MYKWSCEYWLQNTWYECKSSTCMFMAQFSINLCVSCTRICFYMLLCFIYIIFRCITNWNRGIWNKIIRYIIQLNANSIICNCDSDCIMYDNNEWKMFDFPKMNQKCGIHEPFVHNNAFALSKIVLYSFLLMMKCYAYVGRQWGVHQLRSNTMTSFWREKKKTNQFMRDQANEVNLKNSIIILLEKPYSVPAHDHWKPTKNYYSW